MTLDPQRRAHRAIRATIRTDGEEAPQVLYDFFDLWNGQHFAGKLGSPLILIAHASSPRRGGDYVTKDVHGLVSRIRVSPANWKHGWHHALGTLLHEMIHAYQHEVTHDLETGYKGHGPGFCAMANAIGTLYGFPEVAPKGRNGKERPECWPTLPSDVVAAPEAPSTAEDEPSESDDENEETDRDRAIRLAERMAVVAFTDRYAALAQEHGKPKLAASIRNLGAKIDRAEHLADNDADE